jgi:hypothetical protein
MKEYIVVAHTEADIDSVHRDLTTDTSFDTSVNHSTIPTRSVGVADARLVMPTMTHYYLTDDEAGKLAQDARVQAVHVPVSYDARKPHVVPQSIKPLNAIERPVSYNNVAGNFNRNAKSDLYNVNWGLRRTSLASTEATVGNTYNYDRAGSGVDIVIMDDGVEVNHPEFLDPSGISRVQLIDWFRASGVSGSMPVNHYNTTRTTGAAEHGTHVASIAAGKTYGYAKSSRIYSLRVFGDATERIPDNIHFDILLGWHLRKPIDPATGVKRPTIVNMSWGYSWYYSDNDMNPTGASITSINYRGNLQTYQTATNRKLAYGQVGDEHGFQVPSEDAACAACERAGIIFVRSAGNSSHKIDAAAGPDYNNYYTVASSWAGFLNPGDPVYYHRGTSPRSGNTIVVSAVRDATVVSNGKLSEQVDFYSERGPGCDVVAPGTNITAATSKLSTYTRQNYVFGTQANGTVFKSTKISGTSMASPQVTGVVALYLSNNPAATAADVKRWVGSMGIKNIISTTNLTNDWGNQYALQGAPNNYLYNPYHNGYTGP